MLVIEWNGLAPAHADRAHHLVSREHRIEQQGVKVKFTRVLLRYERHCRVAHQWIELHGPLFQHRNAADGFARKRPRISLPQPALDAWLPVGGSHFDHVVVECLDHGKGGIEQAPQAFGDRIEYRLGVIHRGAYGGKDFRGRGLLLERFLQVAGARLDLFEQPDVRNRDDGLVGEHLDRLDLTLRERLKVRLAQHDRADDLTFVQKRRHQKRARTAKAYPALAQLRNFIHHVGEMERALFSE